MLRKAFVAVVIGLGFALLVAAPASATTFCVPGYHAACPNSGANVAQPSLGLALSANGEDGVPDKVIIDDYTWTDPGTLDANGTDPLEIVGAGTDKTVITSSTTANVYVMRSGFGERELTVRDLTIRVPASIIMGGAGLFLEEGHIENVNIETRHPDTPNALVAAGSVTYDGGRISGAGGGSFGEGVTTNGTEPGAFELEGVTIDGADIAVLSKASGQPVVLRRCQILNTSNAGVLIYLGGDARVENSIIEAGNERAFLVASASNKVTHLDIESSTIVAAGNPTVPAIEGFVNNVAGNDSIRIEVRNSIFRDFDSTFQLSAPANNAALGNAHISFEHSNFNLFGTRAGDGSTYIAPNNINQDPLFASAATGNYALTKASPSIDAGDPAADKPATDYLGRTRPIDGDDNGTAVRDQGAYEFVPDHKGPPPSCETDPKLCPDKAAPKITAVKVRAPKGKKAGSVKLTLSEAATIKVTFKPKPKGKRKTVKLTKAGKAGANTLKIKKNKLKSGRYKVTITASDTAGNKAKPVTRTLKVKPASCSNREKRC